MTLRKGWEVKKLGDICKLFADGDWIESKDQSNSGFRLIQTGNIGIGYFKDRVDKARYVSESTFARLNCNEIFPNDLLISRLPDPVGRACIIPDTGERMITAVDCTIIRINPIIIKPEYLVYYTCSKTYLLEVESQSGGATRQRISRKNLSQITIPIPPLPEQQRIVDILDEAFAGIDTAIANTQQAISNAQELFDTELNRIFSQRGEGWEVKRLSDLGTITSSKRIFKNEYVPEGVPFFRTKEIKELANAETITTELFISKKRYDDIKLSFGVPNAGDILLTAIGTIGEIWVVESNKKFYFKDGNVLWLKNFTSINPYFLKYALIAFIEQIKSKANGSAYNALSIQQLNAHTIFMPSLEFQVNIVAKLDSLKDQTQALTDAYQRKLAALQELKQSLLHKAFTGELTANWQASSGC